MVTVVFIDIVGSTELGERLDPEALKGVLTQYFGQMRAVLERHGGLLEKYVGDAILVVFGVPKLHEDDALRAVRAATEMREMLRELNPGLLDAYGVTLQARTGVNTGEVLQGDIASGQALALGHAVNVAARLEQAAGPDEILIGKTTFDLTRLAIDAEPAARVSTRGDGWPVPAYRLNFLTGPNTVPWRAGSALVGRSAELAALREAFDRAGSQRRCERVTIIGPAGVGKSRLIREFVARLGPAASVVRGRCLPYGDQITYWPFREMVRDAVGATESDPPEVVRDKLVSYLRPAGRGRLTTLLSQLLRLETPVATHDELTWGVRQFLELLALDHPVVVVLDDLQWADPAMLALLRDVHTGSGGFALLFLCVFRHDSDPDSALAVASWLGSTLVLDPLDETETRRLMENLASGSQFPEEVRSRVVEAAEGNPLFVEQLLDMLIDEGRLEHRGTGWRVAGRLERLNAPPTIRALLAARLDLLAEDERQVVGTAALVGRVFHRQAVAALVDRRLRAGLDAVLAALRAKDLIRQDPHDPRRQLYRFRHPLIREVAYHAMPKGRRAELHEGFAVWLEAAVGDRVQEYDEIVGHHLEQAGRYRAELGPERDRGSSLHQARDRWQDRAARPSEPSGHTRVRRKPSREPLNQGSGSEL